MFQINTLWKYLLSSLLGPSWIICFKDAKSNESIIDINFFPSTKRKYIKVLRSAIWSISSSTLKRLVPFSVYRPQSHIKSKLSPFIPLWWQFSILISGWFGTYEPEAVQNVTFICVFESHVFDWDVIDTGSCQIAIDKKGRKNYKSRLDSRFSTNWSHFCSTVGTCYDIILKWLLLNDFHFINKLWGLLLNQAFFVWLFGFDDRASVFLWSNLQE